MTEIINLRRVRKRARKEQQEAEAAAHRVEFGRTKNERALSEADNQRTQRHIDAHKIGDE